MFDGLSDGALMTLAGERDARAFGVFYARHIGPARALSYRTLGNPHEAEDVCQEAFMTMWRVAGRYDATQASAKAWVLTIVRNRAIDHRRVVARTRAREVTNDALVSGRPAPAEQQPEHRALDRLQADALRVALDTLSVDQRRVIDLSFYGGFSHGEIAAMLGLPAGTVKAHARRGLARMRGQV